MVAGVPLHHDQFSHVPRRLGPKLALGVTEVWFRSRPHWPAVRRRGNNKQVSPIEHGGGTVVQSCGLGRIGLDLGDRTFCIR